MDFASGHKRGGLEVKIAGTYREDNREVTSLNESTTLIAIQHLPTIF